MQPITTLIIPAAGAGTRLRPITYATPKEMLRLVDKPVAYYLLAEAHHAGITNVIFIIHKDNDATRVFFESEKAQSLLADFPNMKISFIETNERRGDGQALLLAKGMVKAGEAFAVTMGDLVAMPGTSLLAELISQYRTVGPVFAVMDVPRKKTKNYGVIDPVDSKGWLHKVRGIVEKPEPEVAPSTFAMNGKYILTPEIFTYLEKIAKETPEGEIKLAHALHAFAQDHVLHAYACSASCYDTGIKSELFRAEVAFTLANPELETVAREILKHFV